jgi:ferredoxin-thioredoxin reductase catalytic chain
MIERINASRNEIEKLYSKLLTEADAGGYILNPDDDFTKSLIDGLLVNTKRYGYQSCPCRLSTGTFNEDKDIICPCDYRDPDLNEFGACYCGLYVSADIAQKRRKLKSIPERRHADQKKEPEPAGSGAFTGTKLRYPIWRCTVCGYICARETPPEVCPICKVPKDRFEKFII